MRHLAKMIMLAAAPATMLAATATPASAGTDEYLGEVMLVGYTFCPRGSIEAAGQLLPINQYQALFSLYGTTFGGDGRTSFGLPDLRGRTPIGYGSQPGLSPVAWGQKGGIETVTLTVNNLPTHSHGAEMRAENAVLADSKNPNNATKALAADNIYSKSNAPNPNVKLSTGSVVLGDAGASLGFYKRDPFLGMRFCIASQGVYPSRN